MAKTVTLDDTEWTSVMTILGNSTGFSWAVTNPLLMKIGAQLQPQPATAGLPAELMPMRRPNGPDDAPMFEEPEANPRRVPRN